MIPKTKIIEMAKALKMPVAEVEAAYDNTDVVDVAMPTGLSVFNEAELLQRDGSIKASTTTSAREILIKEMKEKAGMEYDGQGSKDPERFITELGKKVTTETGVKESDKVKTLNETVTTLQTNLTTLQGQLADKNKEVASVKLEGDILTHTIHMKPDHYTNAEWVNLIKMNNEIVEDNGATVVKRDGKVVADTTTLKPTPVAEALTSFITERKWGKVEQTTDPIKSRREPDSKYVPGSIANMKQFKEHLVSQGINANGEQAKTLLAEITTANPNFDMNEPA